MPRELGAMSKRKKGHGASSETTTLNAKLSNEELLRQLKALAEELTSTEQSTNTNRFDTQAAFLASPFIIKHKDKDVRLHAALCLVDILRVYAPEAPFDKDQMWHVFSLIISQLRGLEHGRNETRYKKPFYILESLALVRTFNICAELDFQDLILQLFKLLFSIVNDNHTVKEQTFMVEIMSPILEESESIPQELLDSVLINIIEPKKSRNPASYKVACNLIQKTAANIEPFIQMFFNSVLTLGKTSESDLADKVYELILELNRISSPVLLSVLPQLEFKLKSTDVEERLTVTKLLAQMFSDPDSELAAQNKPLWNCYLGRYHDINVDIRVECVRNSKHFVLHHPELAQDITEKLISRSRDPDERVRQEVVTVTCDIAAENIKNVSDTLFDEVCERTRDKKWTVRGEALMCLGKLYKRFIAGPNADSQVARKLCWLPSKLIHGYYQNMVEDRLCVERVLSGCLVPVTLKTKERMKLLLSLYTQLDQHAVGAFNVLLKCQANVRADLAALVALSENDKSEENDTAMLSHVITLARALPEPYKSQENLKKLQSMLSEIRTRELFKIAVDGDAGCPAVFKAVADIVVKLGARSPILETIKALLDRAAPVMIDTACVKALLEMVKTYLEGLGDDDDDEDDDGDSATQKGDKGMELLLTLSGIFPSHFRTQECYETILVFLKHTDHQIVNNALHILSNVADGMETNNKDVSIYYQPVLTKLACKGTPEQAKYAMKSIAKIFKDPSSIFERIFTSVVENLEYDHPLLLSYLTTLAQVAVLAPSIFETKQKSIIRDFVVKELLVKDRSTVEEADSQGDDDWCDDCDVSRETQAKVKGIKLMIRWLQGLQNNYHNSALPVLRLLCTLLANGGDLQNNGCVCSHDCSRLRLAASCGILKVAQEMNYEDSISLEHFQRLALIMQDFCTEVKTIFTKKLHKALDTLKLPLEYLSIFALAASDTEKERKDKVRQMISRNVSIRKEYLKQHSAAQACSHSLLPEYALPSVIHLLAHHPDFKPKDHDSLVQFKEYLCFFMEPILSNKTENLGLLKKLVETIKLQTKDAQKPDDQDANEALYTLCDLAYGLIINKAGGAITDDFPGQPLLPKKMFQTAKMDPPNTKSYLPAGFVFFPGKRKPIAYETTKKNSKPAKSTSDKNKKTFKSMVNKMDESGVKTTNARKRTAPAQRNASAKKPKETSESSEEESGLDIASPETVKKRILTDDSTERTSRTTPKENTSPTKKTRRTANTATKTEIVRSSPRKTPEKTSPRKRPSANKRSSLKPEDTDSNNKPNKATKRLREEVDLSSDDDNGSPLASRKIKQKAVVNGLSSPKKQTKKRETKASPVKTKTKSTVASPVKKRQTSSPTKRQKSSVVSPRKQKSQVLSPKKAKASPKKPSKGTPVKRKAASPSKRQSTPASPAKNTRTAKRSPAKKQTMDSPRQQTALNVKRRTTRRR